MTRRAGLNGLVVPVLVLAAMMATGAGPAFAVSPPGTVFYQVELRDLQNNPLNGTFDMEFRLYPNPLGQAIIIDQHTGSGGVPVANGEFAVELGGGVVSDGPGPGTYLALREVLRDFGTVYLEVKVG